MKAITLTQPWATLVAIGAKKIETRSWKTGYRGPLAIHAAKSGSGATRTELNEMIRRPHFAEVLRRPDGTLPLWEQLPLGQIVAVCRLVDCREMDTKQNNPFWNDTDGLFDIGPDGTLSDQERAFGRYDDYRFAWMLSDVVTIAPVAYRGGLGLWDLKGDLCFPHGMRPDWLP